MHNRNYYTFIELLMALREQYQKSQQLLSNMKEDLKITSDKPFNCEMFLDMPILSPRVVRKESEVKLHVYKDYHVGIGPYMRHMLRNTNRMDLYWGMDHAMYILKNDGKYYFDKIPESGIQYNPEVIIPNFLQNEFDRYYQELKSLELSHLPEVRISNQPHLVVDGNSLVLFNHDRNYDIDFINYQANDDKIYVMTCERGKIWGNHYNDLFETEIPCYKLPKEYLEYLEKTNSKPYNRYSIKIDDYIKRKGNFSIEEKEDQLVLTKTLGKKK